MASTSKLPEVDTSNLKNASTIDVKTSSNPFTLLSNLDPSKKYTLVFLFSVGTTLLVTGFSGGKLLKKAKSVTATPVSTPTVTPSPIIPSTITTKLKPVKFRPTPSSSSSILNPLPPPPSYIPPSGMVSRRKPKSLLRQWSSPSLSSNNNNQEFFLPNSLLLSQSNAFASALDKEDQLHKDGSIALTFEESEILRLQQEKDGIIIEDDGFNPAVFAAKAFGIATILTVGSFGLVLAGVMTYFGVSDVSFSCFFCCCFFPFFCVFSFFFVFEFLDRFLNVLEW